MPWPEALIVSSVIYLAIGMLWVVAEDSMTESRDVSRIKQHTVTSVCLYSVSIGLIVAIMYWVLKGF